MDVQFGNLPIFKLPWLQWPKNVGADVSGKVIAVGEGVDELQRGDEVFGLTFKPVSSFCSVLRPTLSSG